MTGAVIVTTPQDIALIDARKGLKMFEKVGIPILGVVENMSFHVCPKCGHESHIFGSGGAEKMCRDYGTELLGQLPLDEAIRSQADSGKLTVVPSRRAARRDLPAHRPALRGQDRRVAARHDLEVPQHRGAEHLRSCQKQRPWSSGRHGLLKVLIDSRKTTRSDCSAALSLSGPISREPVSE